MARLLGEGRQGDLREQLRGLLQSGGAVVLLLRSGLKTLKVPPLRKVVRASLLKEPHVCACGRVPGAPRCHWRTSQLAGMVRSPGSPHVGPVPLPSAEVQGGNACCSSR